MHILVEDDGDEEFEDECDVDADIDVSMDDILDKPPAPPKLSAKAGDDWIEHDGHKFHKSSLLRIIFGSYFVPKSKVRLERVRAYTIEAPKTEADAADETLVGVSLFLPGDLFATLVRSRNTVALAVLQATSITHRSHKVASISTAELALYGADITILGQVLHLIMPSISAGTDSPSDNILELLGTAPSSTMLLTSSSLESTTNISAVTRESSATSILSSNILIDDKNPCQNSPTLLWIGDYVKFNPL